MARNVLFRATFGVCPSTRYRLRAAAPSFVPINILRHNSRARPNALLKLQAQKILSNSRIRNVRPQITARLASTSPVHPPHRGPVFKFLYRFLAYAGGFVLVSGGLVLAFFIYDASTYREDLTYTDIGVSQHALEPKRGGPKNLPIAQVLVDDDDCQENANQKDKPKLVILGTGWGSVAMLKTLNPGDYHVTVVSPVNYFLFTPMLPSATVGTLELRSLVEPVRRIVQRARGHFLKAEAVDVDLSEKLVEVAQTDASGNECRFYLPYDKLVLGVGTSSPNHQCFIR